MVVMFICIAKQALNWELSATSHEIPCLRWKDRPSWQFLERRSKVETIKVHLLSLQYCIACIRTGL